MGLRTSYGKGPHPLLWAGSQVARGKIAVSGIPNRLNYSVIFVLCTLFTNAAGGRGFDTHDLDVRVIAYSVNTVHRTVYQTLSTV